MQLHVVRATIIDSSGRILLARRSQQTVLSGLWELPGGKVDPGETALQALEREIAEETGLDIILGDHLIDDKDVWSGAPILTQIWRALACESHLRLNAREHDDAGWFWPHQTPDQMTPSARLACEKLAALSNEPGYLTAA